MAETDWVEAYKALIDATKARESPEEFRKALRTSILPTAKRSLGPKEYEQIEKYASEQEKG